MKTKEDYALMFKITNEQMKDSHGLVLRRLYYRRCYYLKRFKDCIKKELKGGLKE